MSSFVPNVGGFFPSRDDSRFERIRDMSRENALAYVEKSEHPTVMHVSLSARAAPAEEEEIPQAPAPDMQKLASNPPAVVWLMRLIRRGSTKSRLLTLVTRAG
ncbi:hypothetical protein DOTSEDRAFT_20824 [Dothistroma septosporum NZE10]|uniref:Uncharacterized protein n=1 Tax=Dothistroma septosporum (strain NZE10 / CBS 128990) TaxID=675120 RepID=N1PU69_DOTSN|nr:hypothetical protein DOTSEDRAFT_20824 [Dothistroma septosporum NZE10]